MTLKVFKSHNLEIIDTPELAIHRRENGDLVIPVKGFVFTNENDRDLEGDYFDTETDRGPLTKLLSYFDHQMSESYIPKESNGVKLKGFGRGRVGHAEKVLTTEEAEIWNIVVDHRHRYVNLVEQLAEAGHLGASSIAFDREDDPEIEGRIKRWDTIAMDLTPTSAEPRAQVIVKNFLDKMFEEEDLVVEENNMSKLEDNIKNAFKNADAEEEGGTTEEEIVEETTETEEEPDNPTAEDVESVGDLEEVKAILLGMTEQFDRIEDSQKSLTDEVKDIQDAFPILADQTARYVSKSIREIAKQTTDEFEAESEILERQRKSANSRKKQKGVSQYAGKMNPNAPGVR